MRAPVTGAITASEYGARKSVGIVMYWLPSVVVRRVFCARCASTLTALYVRFSARSVNVAMFVMNVASVFSV